MAADGQESPAGRRPLSFAAEGASSPGLFGTASLVACGALGPPPRGPLSKKLTGKPLDRWSVDDVCQWTRAMGLGCYESSFRQSKVNGDSLARLTQTQMRDVLGIIELFHQRSFLSAQAALKQALAGAQRRHRAVASNGSAAAAAVPPAHSLWTCDEVASWFEDHEITGVRSVLAAHAVHGALLVHLNQGDLRAMGLTSPLLVWKMDLHIRTLLQAPADGAARPAEPWYVAAWKAKHVVDWLSAVGLAQYVGPFRANGINGRALFYLNRPQMEQLTMTNDLHQRSVVVGRVQLRHQEPQSRRKKLPWPVSPRRLLSSGGASAGGATTAAGRGRRSVAQWSSAKVGKWLAKNDFADRKPTFMANGVHGSLLLELTDGDLQKHLQMTNVVERERLLRDIRRLAGVTESPGSSRHGSPKRLHAELVDGDDQDCDTPPRPRPSKDEEAPPSSAVAENSSPQKRRRKSSQSRSRSSLTRASAAAAGATYGRAPFLPDRRSPMGFMSAVGAIEDGDADPPSDEQSGPAARGRSPDPPTAAAAPAGAAGRPRPIAFVVDAASPMSARTSPGGGPAPATADEVFLHPAYAAEGSQYSRLSLIREPSKNMIFKVSPKQQARQQHEARASPGNAENAVEPDPEADGRDLAEWKDEADDDNNDDDDDDEDDDGEYEDAAETVYEEHRALESEGERGAPQACLSCGEQEINCTLDPCKHQVTCLDCVAFLERCPSCNIEIEAVSSSILLPAPQ